VCLAVQVLCPTAPLKTHPCQRSSWASSITLPQDSYQLRLSREATSKPQPQINLSVSTKAVMSKPLFLVSLAVNIHPFKAPSPVVAHMSGICFGNSHCQDFQQNASITNWISIHLKVPWEQDQLFNNHNAKASAVRHRSHEI